MIRFRLTVFLEVTANIAYAVQKSSEIIATSKNEEEIAKAKRVQNAAVLAREGIKSYNTLKSIPKYQLAFKKFGIDALHSSMIELCSE